MTAREICTTPVHREDHAALLDIRPDLHSRRSAVDAIVVPAARPADNLQAVADLAQAAGCLLVVLCSAAAKVQAVRELVCSVPRLRAMVVDLPQHYEHRLLRFSTSIHLLAGDQRHVDLSTKRNLGLLMARLLGWSRVLFVDDDIRGLDVRQLDWAAALLDRYHVAGFRITKFPDNSVVCHANRLAGRDQQVFLGANALLIDVQSTTSFFPAVYNEDWLFLFDSLRSRAVAAVGTARQLAYDPYESPARAASEEFGDTVAEGLLRLLHEGMGLESSDESFWQTCLAHRRAFLDQVADRLLAKEGRGEAKRAINSLTAARERLQVIEPAACESFVNAWRTDAAEWSERLVNIPLFTSARRALRYLGLDLISIEVS